MRKILFLILVFGMLFISSCNCGGDNDDDDYNNNNNITLDSSNEIKTITLTVDKTKIEINEKATFSLIVDNGIWLNTGSETKKEDLRIFYYVNDSETDNRLLGNVNIGETFQIYSDAMETFEVYCILAHKNYQSSNNETIYLRSNTVEIKVTGKEIYTAQDLQNIQKTGNYVLMNDIDLNGFDYKVIDEFNGSLDGQGYSIKNLTLTTKQDYVGLFGKCGGTVKNLKLENVNITLSEGAKEYKYVGGIAGYSNQGYFENITVTGKIEANKTDYVGGIVGYLYRTKDTKWENLKNEANITGASYVGGLFGELQGSNGGSYNLVIGTYEIIGCENTGTITGISNYVGGLFGYLNCSTSTIEESNNTGDVKGNLYVGGIAAYCSGVTSYGITNKSKVEGTAYVGGLFGYLNGTIDKCSNEGSILICNGYKSVNEKCAYFGGYVGYGYFLIIKNCTNTVDLNYTSDGSCVGGIAGYVYQTSDTKWENLKNEANITGASYVGGLIGELQGSNGSSYSYDLVIGDYEIIGCENTGTIIGTSNYIGGLFGYLRCSILIIKDSSNISTITGNKWVGGIAGYLSCSSSSEAFNLLSNGSVIGTEKYGGYFGEGSLTFRD